MLIAGFGLSLAGVVLLRIAFRLGRRAGLFSTAFWGTFSEFAPYRLKRLWPVVLGLAGAILLICGLVLLFQWLLAYYAARLGHPLAWAAASNPVTCDAVLRFPDVRRWHPFVWLGMPLLLAACQASAGGSPSPTPSVAPSLEAGAFTTPCQAEQLSVSLRYGPFSEPTGQNSSTVIIANISSSGCYLFGYPVIAFVDSTGHILPFQYQTSGDQVVTPAAPLHVDVPAHGLAYVTVNKYRCDLGDLMQASHLRITLPGQTASFDVAMAGPPIADQAILDPSSMSPPSSQASRLPSLTRLRALPVLAA